VTTNVPQLTRADIQGKLEELLGAKRRHYLFALHGTGDPDVLRIDGAPAEMPVIPVRSELDLRRRLVELGDVTCATFLVPWEGSLPMDLQGRFARDGYVFRVGRETRILALFGAVEIEPEVRASPLVSYLLQHETERFPGGGRLTIDRLWQSWLERACRLRAGQELALDALLGWAASDGGGPAWAELLDRRSAGDVRHALHEHLASRLGLAGQLAWRCWERGEGSAALEMAVLAAAVASANGDPAVAMWWQLTLPQVLDHKSAMDASARLAEASEPALRAYEGRAGNAAARKLVEAADARIQIEALRPALNGSTRLPSAWRGRLDRLGEALVAAADDRSREAAAEAVVRLRALRGHVLYADGDQGLTMERAEMAVRLASWLALRLDRAIERSPTPYTEVECLSAWYAAEGGYVDWARRWARGGGSGGLFRGIGAVLAAVDRERAELDRTFAAGLPHYFEARRPADRCIPIDQMIERIAGRFLKERPERRLLVLLMDGMAWAQAVEILAGLGNESSAWGPVAWHGIRKNRIGDNVYPPVLASFPTLTEISRSALFAGRPMQVGKTHRSDDDPDRWKANKIAVAYSDPGAGPRLLLRGEGQTKDGAATSEALSLVEDKRRRIVAVVINAIDSSLKADSAQRMKWTADAIKSLRDLLDKAREVGRTVLLCADHGHVPADRLEPAGHAKKEGARWRTWEKPEDPRAEFEVGLPATAEGVWAPAGAHGVILLTDDGRKYGGGASAGEHGGASLAEVVAPCLLIGCEDHPDVDADPELGVRPATAPGWWNFDLGVALPTATVGTPEPKPRRPKAPISNQLVMPIAPVAPPPPAKAPDESTPSLFARSKVLEARVPAGRRAQVIRAVDFLLSRHGIADASAFAAAMETFPLRVGGLVSLLAELLNIDGYEVLTYDKQTRQVRLDRGKLFEQFEVNE
jgi:hypothetical protein